MLDEMSVKYFPAGNVKYALRAREILLRNVKFAFGKFIFIILSFHRT
jgi:hypothetical protein